MQCCTAASLAPEGQGNEDFVDVRSPHVVTGLAAIDELQAGGEPVKGLAPGSFLQVCGTTAAGKSLIALQAVANALVDGLNVPRLARLVKRAKERRGRGDRQGLSSAIKKAAVLRAALEVRQEARALLQRRARSLGPSIATPPLSASITQGKGIASSSSVTVSAVVVTAKAPLAPAVGSKRARSLGAADASHRPRLPGWLIKGLVAAHPLVASARAPSSSSSFSSSSVIGNNVASREPRQATPPSFVLYLDFDRKLDCQGPAFRALLRQALAKHLQIREGRNADSDGDGLGCPTSLPALEALCIKDCLSRLLVVRPTTIREGVSALLQLVAAPPTLPPLAAADPAPSTASALPSPAPMAKVAIYTGNGALFDGPDEAKKGSAPLLAKLASPSPTPSRSQSASAVAPFKVGIGLVVLDGHRSLAMEEATQLLPPYSSVGSTGFADGGAPGVGGSGSGSGGGGGGGRVSPEELKALFHSLQPSVAASSSSYPSSNLQRLKDIARVVEERLRPLYGDTSLSPLAGHFIALLQQKLIALASGQASLPSMAEGALRQAYFAFAMPISGEPSALASVLRTNPRCSVIAVERQLPTDSYLHEAFLPPLSSLASSPSPTTPSIPLAVDLALSGRRVASSLPSSSFRWKLHGYDESEGVNRAKAVAAAAQASRKSPSASTAVNAAEALDGILGNAGPGSGAGAGPGSSAGAGAAAIFSSASAQSAPPLLWSVPGRPRGAANGATASEQIVRNHPLHVALLLQKAGVLPVPLASAAAAKTPRQIVEGAGSSSDAYQHHPYASLCFSRAYLRRPFVLLPGNGDAPRPSTESGVAFFGLKDLNGLVTGKPVVGVNPFASVASGTGTATGLLIDELMKGGPGGTHADAIDGAEGRTACFFSNAVTPVVSWLLTASSKAGE